jgi:hypothetical protein
MPAKSLLVIKLLLYEVNVLEPLAHHLIVKVVTWLDESQIHINLGLFLICIGQMLLLPSTANLL